MCKEKKLALRAILLMMASVREEFVEFSDSHFVSERKDCLTAMEQLARAFEIVKRS